MRFLTLTHRHLMTLLQIQIDGNEHTHKSTPYTHIAAGLAMIPLRFWTNEVTVRQVSVHGNLTLM